jgi:hypothetical protein
VEPREVYYESRNRDLKTRPIYVCRCDERLKTKSEKSTLLGYTGFLGELEHLRIKTRLIDEMFPSVMGEHVFLKFVYYESRKRELQTRPTYECRSVFIINRLSMKD